MKAIVKPGIQPVLRDRPLTGRHVLVIALAAFAVIIGANMTMLFAATGTFPGLVVKNSYVASQGWNARAEASAALGWQARVGYGDGAVWVVVHDAAGAPVTVPELRLRVGRPTHDGADRVLTAQWVGDGYTAPVALDPGRWQVEVDSPAVPAFRRLTTLTVDEVR